MTTISVVIPVKDDAEMLDRCLYTLSIQSRPADEIIVVDNNSTDHSADIARKYGIEPIKEPVPGITAAASAGYDAARGDIIARCDADSRLPADWLERIEKQLDEHPEAVAITGPGRFYDMGRPWRWFASLIYMRSYFFSMRGALANAALFGSNFAIRRSSWLRISPDVPRDIIELHDDMDLSYRIDPATRVIYDRSLIVGISGRPLNNLGGIKRRLKMASRTFDQHWPEQSPVARWSVKVTNLNGGSQEQTEEREQSNL